MHPHLGERSSTGGTKRAREMRLERVRQFRRMHGAARGNPTAEARCRRCKKRRGAAADLTIDIVIVIVGIIVVVVIIIITIIVGNIVIV